MFAIAAIHGARNYLVTPVICLASRVATGHTVVVVVRRHYVVFELSERSGRSGGPGTQRSVALATAVPVARPRRLMVVMMVVFAHVYGGQHFGSAQQPVIETTEQVALYKNTAMNYYYAT